MNEDLTVLNYALVTHQHIAIRALKTLRNFASGCVEIEGLQGRKRTRHANQREHRLASNFDLERSLPRRFGIDLNRRPGLQSFNELFDFQRARFERISALASLDVH